MCHVFGALPLLKQGPMPDFSFRKVFMHTQLTTIEPKHIPLFLSDATKAVVVLHNRDFYNSVRGASTPEIGPICCRYMLIKARATCLLIGTNLGVSATRLREWETKSGLTGLVSGSFGYSKVGLLTLPGMSTPPAYK